MSEKKRKKKIRDSKSETIAMPSALKYEENHFIDTSKTVWNYSMLTDEDVSNFKEGTHY